MLPHPHPVASIRNAVCFLAVAFLTLARATGLAGVTRVEIDRRTPHEKSDYETIEGTLHFSVDPEDPKNRIIADIELAPKDESGNVTFSSDFRLLCPKDGAESAVAVWAEIPNRGGSSNLQPFMVENHFALFEVGWEFDVASDPKRLAINVPKAVEKDGSPIRGSVEAIFILNERKEEFTVTDLADYPPVDPEGSETRLTVRDHGDRPGGKELPRDTWNLEGNHLTLEGGFEPGKTYEITWLAENPPVAGLGFAAIRDAVSWIKHDAASPAPGLPVYSQGASQCGRLLREFVYEGFNTDLNDEPVFQGIIAHIAGAGRVDLNRRWSTPKELSLFRTASYPFSDEAWPDPVTGLKEGILENPRVTHRPKIFYTTTAAEYWGAGRVAALVHTDPAAEKDVPLPEGVRLYVFAGSQHGPSAFPPTPAAEGAPLSNPTNFRDSLYSLRLALHRWVTEEKMPPASAYPTFATGTLIPAKDLAFPELSGVATPNDLTAGLRMRNPFLPEGAGAGTELPLLVSQVDADGNDLAGLRLPEISVPLATATGWMFRPAEMGAPHELLPVLRGSWFPFALTKADREKSGDPRLSIEERYRDREDFLEKTKEAATLLVEKGYLRDEDIESSVKRAATTWDWLHGQ
jgi:hypothetical protein